MSNSIGPKPVAPVAPREYVRAVGPRLPLAVVCRVWNCSALLAGSIRLPGLNYRTRVVFAADLSRLH